MKATISKNGELIIEPETEMEKYALDQWVKNAEIDVFTGDLVIRDLMITQKVYHNE